MTLVRPPLRAQEMQPVPLLERKRELALVESLLIRGTTRLLTLTGPAGVGKTRLALEAAQQFSDAFSRPSRFVDLTAIYDPDEAASALVDCLPEAAEAPTLLIVDNFERVLPAAAQLELLLTRAPGLRVLATSREILHLRMEHAIAVRPLSVPDLEHLPKPEDLAEVAAVALFLQRARQINPEFRLTEQNAHAVAEVCVHLDGLPLAIELAAARSRVLSPQMLLQRLSRRLTLLHWQAQDLPSRHRALRNAIDWSYNLLSPDEQRFFRNLSVFVGGFTLDAAKRVLSQATHGEPEVVNAISSLVDRSLVQPEDDGAGGIRFRLLESMHGVALEKKALSDDKDAEGRAHAHYYLELAERAAPQLVGPSQRERYLALERERGNIRAALRWLWDHSENESALRLVGAMAQFWEVRGYLAEGERALADCLARIPDADPRLRAHVLIRLASIRLPQVISRTRGRRSRTPSRSGANWSTLT